MTTLATAFTNNTEYKLSDFTVQDKLGASVIALNADKNQLLYLTKAPESASCLVIDLNNLNGCSITKEYNNIKPGDLKKNKLHKFLKSIFLNLRSKNGRVKLTLFNALHDAPADAHLLESKARKWQKIVSKYLKTKKLHKI